jgi:hypothetical protein
MSRDNDLPFARGSTYCQGDATAIAALGVELEGRVFRTKDPTTGRDQRLIVLKNGHSDALTVAGIGLAPQAGYLGRRTAAAVSSARGFGLIGDPEYGSTTIASGDLFYAIYDGFVSNAKTHTTTITDLDVVGFHSDGKILPATDTEGWHIGMAVETVTSPTSGDPVDLIVNYPYFVRT